MAPEHVKILVSSEIASGTLTKFEAMAQLEQVFYKKK
jgi:hypothetical protein